MKILVKMLLYNQNMHYYVFKMTPKDIFYVKEVLWKIKIIR